MSDGSTQRKLKRRGYLLLATAILVLPAVGAWYGINTLTANQLDLMQMIEIGDVDGVRYHLHWRRERLDWAIWPGRSPLYRATELGRAKIVEALLQAGVNPDSVDAERETALRLAVREERAAIVETLLRHGCRTDIFGQSEFAPLHYAVFEESLDIIRLLLKYGADPTARSRDPMRLTSLELAAADGKYDGAKVLLENGVPIDHPDTRGRTALYWAAWEGQSGIADLLLEHGAGVNHRDHEGNTPLHFAGDADVVDVLMKHGADVKARSRSGNTALHQQCKFKRDPETVAALISAGIEVNARNDDGRSALMIAVDWELDDDPSAGWDPRSHGPKDRRREKRCSVRIARVLLRAGADPNVTDRFGRTPLFHVLRDGDRETAECFMAHGAPLRGLAWPSALAFAGDQPALEQPDRHFDETYEQRYRPDDLTWAPSFWAIFADHPAAFDAAPGGHGEDEHWRSGISLAAEWGSTSCLRNWRLHKKTLNPKHRQRVPLIEAARYGELEAAEILIRNGAEINRTDDLGHAPLTAALKRRDVAMVKLLLKAGAHPSRRLETKISYRRTVLTEPPMKLAVQSGNIEIVKAMLAAKAKPGYWGSLPYNQPSALAIAREMLAAGGSPEHALQCLYYVQDPAPFVDLYLDAGADVNAVSEGGWTLAHQAAAPVIRALAKHGVDLNRQNDEGWTPLELAVMSGQDSISRQRAARALRELGAAVKGLPPEHMLAFAGDAAGLKDLLAQRPTAVHTTSRGKWTPLHWAAWRGNPATIKVLLEHKADISARNGFKYTPLHVAAFWGSAEAIQLLIDAGADPNAPAQYESRTPLVLAIRSGNPETVRRLLANGLALNPADKDVLPPIAAAMPKPAVFSELVDAGARMRGGRPSSWIYEAVDSGNPAALKWVLANLGDDVGDLDSRLSLCRGNFADELVQLLLQAGASPDGTPDQTTTPLHTFAKRGAVELVRLLIKAGARVNLLDDHNHTPLECAAAAGHRQIVELLKQHQAETGASQIAAGRRQVLATPFWKLAPIPQASPYHPVRPAFTGPRSVFDNPPTMTGAAKEAEIICLGRAASLTKTADTTTVQAGDASMWHSEKAAVWKADFRVAHTLKGEPAETLSVSYPFYPKPKVIVSSVPKTAQVPSKDACILFLDKNGDTTCKPYRHDYYVFPVSKDALRSKADTVAGAFMDSLRGSGLTAEMIDQHFDALHKLLPPEKCRSFALEIAKSANPMTAAYAYLTLIKLDVAPPSAGFADVADQIAGDSNEEIAKLGPRLVNELIKMIKYRKWSDDGLQVLHTILQNPDSRVFAHALTAVAEFARPASEKPLVRCLQNQKLSVRNQYWCLVGLSRIRQEDLCGGRWETFSKAPQKYVNAALTKYRK